MNTQSSTSSLFDIADSGKSATDSPTQTQAADAQKTETSEPIPQTSGTLATAEITKGAAPPVDNEFKLKLAEGSRLSTGDLERIVAEAKAGGLSEEQAQQLLQREDSAVARYVDAQDKELNEERARWRKESESDPEIGGQKIAETNSLARAVLDRFDKSGDVRKLLEETDLGNNVVALRFLREIGIAMRPDTLHSRGSGVNNKKIERSADVLFGSVD